MKSIQWYCKGKLFHHAVAIARENGLDDELLQVASLANKEVKEEVACYFEEKGEVERAANLYFKSGRLTKALELCNERPHECGHIFEMIGTNL